MPVETQKHSAALRTITPQTNEISTLRFDVPLTFKPGQSIAVAFPGDPKKRYYSISSSPTEGAFVEITVKSEAGTPLAQALSQLKRGDVIELEGPMGGALSLPEPIQEPLAFIAAGTGVAPFRSMIRYMIDGFVTSDYHLLHSVRSQQELLFHNDFVAWSGTHKNFHYVPTITRDFDDNWENETGRINETLIRKHVTVQSCTYLLCGLKSFVDDMEKALREQLNIPAEKIRREKW